MSLADFENGYSYAAELKDFAQSIGIAEATRLRKDQLEKNILAFLRTGIVSGASAPRRERAKKGESDLSRGLRLEMRIENYTS
jgi:hypothetical protein